MDENIANQICELLNRRNNLSCNVTFDRVYYSKGTYLYITDKSRLVGCACVKKVQWYQNELLHLSVHEDYENMGYGSRLIASAKELAKQNRGRILQATADSKNLNSIKVLKNNGFNTVGEFINQKTENKIIILQDIL